MARPPSGRNRNRILIPCWGEIFLCLAAYILPVGTTQPPVQWTLCSLSCTVDTAQSLLYGGHRAVSPAQWTPCSCSCTVDTVQYLLHSGHRAVSPVQWTPCSLSCTVDTVQSVLYGGHRAVCPREVNMFSHLHVMSRLRMHGAIPQLPILLHDGVELNPEQEHIYLQRVIVNSNVNFRNNLVVLPKLKHVFVVFHLCSVLYLYNMDILQINLIKTSDLNDSCLLLGLHYQKYDLVYEERYQNIILLILTYSMVQSPS